MGRELGSAAHMTGLVRTRQGEFELADCLDVSGVLCGCCVQVFCWVVRICVVGTCFGVENRPDSLCISAAENGDEIIAMLKKSSDSIPQPRPPQTPPPTTTL